ncbi:MAG: hypothetical protein CMF71_07495 [Magnetovibrio sp.]|nr:hypothetical protein [Magnetovibrio sp.]
MKPRVSQPPRLSDRLFGIVFSTIFFTIGMICWFFFNFTVLWAFWISLGLALIAWLAPGVLLPLNRLWATFAQKLGTFNNFILLGTFFFLFMVPIGGILSLIGKDPMMRKKNKKTLSYWTPVSRQAEPKTFSDMF